MYEKVSALFMKNNLYCLQGGKKVPLEDFGIIHWARFLEHSSMWSYKLFRNFKESWSLIVTTLALSSYILIFSHSNRTLSLIHDTIVVLKHIWRLGAVTTFLYWELPSFCVPNDTMGILNDTMGIALKRNGIQWTQVYRQEDSRIPIGYDEKT